MYTKSKLIIIFLVSLLVLPLAFAQCTAKEGNVVVPLIGYYQCDEIDTGKIKNIYVDNGEWLICGDDEYTPACDIVVKSPKEETWFFNLFNKRTQLFYKICDSNWNCRLEDTIDNVQTQPSGSILIDERLLRGDKIFFYYQAEEFLQGFKEIENAKIVTRMNYDAYGLRIFPNTAAPKVVNSQGCFLTDRKICKSGKECENYGTVDRLGTLDFTETVGYLENFVSSPFNFQLQNHPRMGQIYCAGNSAYTLEQLENFEGCYFVPGNIKETQRTSSDFECCLGQTTGDAVCQNFKWVSTKKADGISCPFGVSQCPNQGNVFADTTDPSRTTLVSYSCESGTCKKSTFKTQCANNQACPTGQVCQIVGNTGTCVDQATVPDLPTRKITEEGSINNGFDLSGLLFTFIGAWVFSIVLLVIIKVLGLIPTPLKLVFSPISKFLDARTFSIISIILALIMTFVFFDFSASITASILGGGMI